MVIHGEITVAAVLNRTRGRKGGLRCHNLVAAEPWFDPGRFRSLGLAVGGGAGSVVVRLGLVPLWCTTCTALSWWRGGGLRQWGTTPELFRGLRGGSVRCLSRLVFVDGFRWHCEDTMQSYYEAFQAGLDHDVMSQSGQSDSQGVPELEASWDWSPMSRDRSWWHSSHGRWSDEDWEWWQRVRSRWTSEQASGGSWSCRGEGDRGAQLSGKTLSTSDRGHQGSFGGYAAGEGSLETIS